MTEEVQVDWEKLRNPPEPFKVIVPDYSDIEFHKKIIRLKDHLMNKYLVTSDEHRNERYIDILIKGGCFTSGSAMYEIGDFQGLLGFVNIVPTFKCAMILSLFDKKIWGKQLVRASEELIHTLMDEFELKRVYTQTADIKIARMAQMVGFEDEGTRPFDFMWNQRLFPSYLLGLTREEE